MNRCAAATLCLALAACSATSPSPDAGDGAAPADATLAKLDQKPPPDATFAPFDLTTKDEVQPDLATPLAMADLATHDLAMPDLVMPDLVMPNLVMPDLVMPDLVMPDLTTVPDLVRPDLVMPDLVMPDFAMPDLVMPDLVMPDFAMPDLLQPTCHDGVQNGMETGVDCGGPGCGQCPIGQGCVAPSDCLSATCQGGFCATGTLFAYYPFDEGHGAVAHDVSGYGRDGTLNNASFGAGEFGGAVLLDGTSADVALPAAPGVPPIGDFTLAAWFYMSAPNPGGRSYVLDLRGDGTANEDAPGLIVDNGGGGYSVHNYLYSEGGPDTEYNVAIPSPIGAWHHLAMVRQGASLTSYYDGQALANTFSSGGPNAVPVNFTHPKRVGTFAATMPGNTYWLNGRVDEVRIYTRALAAGEVAKLAGH